MQPESLILLALLGGMLLLLVSRTRRQQRDARTLQAGITVGTRIMTTAGLHATVIELDDTTVTLETGPGQQSRWDRRAIARVLADGSEVEGESATDGVAAHTTADGTTEDDVPATDAAPPERA